MRPRPPRSTHHDAASPRREGASGLRRYRHAQGHRWARHAGSGGPAPGSLLGPSLCIPGPEGEPHQDRVLGWHRPLPFHQAARARRIPLAVERRPGWDADAELGAVVDADRRRRLARTRAAVATGRGGVIPAAGLLTGMWVGG